MPLDAERVESYKERVREGMRKQSEEIDEGKVERIVSDLIATAEIFVESEFGK